MKIFLQYILILLLFIGGSGATFAQKNGKKGPIKSYTDITQNTVIDSTPFNQRLINEMFDYMYSTREEKLYLHTDKESCQPTDTIWFRGYLISAATNKLASKKVK